MPRSASPTLVVLMPGVAWWFETVSRGALRLDARQSRRELLRQVLQLL